MTPAFAHDRGAITVTGHLDGACLRFGGEIVDVFPTLTGANAARHLAHEALAQLAACLAMAPTRKEV